MKLEHLKSMLFQKNKKGRLREIRIIPRLPKPPYASGGTRRDTSKKVVLCAHCNVPVATVPANTSVVGATCSACISRERLARLAA